MLMRTPQNCCHQCLCPCGESSLPPTLSEALPIPEGMSGPDCYVTFYPLCPGARDLMYSLQEWFLFPPVLWSVHGIFKARVLEWGAIAFSKYAI